MTGRGYRLLASGQTLESSFSALSTPIFAAKVTKYLLFSIVEIYKICKSLHRSKHSKNLMLKNAYLDAKIGVDTAENEPVMVFNAYCGSMLRPSF